MEDFDLPTLDGLHLVPGLLDGVSLGVESLAGFPSPKTLPNTVVLDFYRVNVHGQESKNKSMVVKIENPHEGSNSNEIARKMIGERIFTGWPFLQEGLVVAVSDALFTYEKAALVQGSPLKVISNPHIQQGLNHWKTKAERIESMYSKKCGVLTGQVDVLLHVRPLKGLKRLENGALVKDYEDADKEIEQALQMCLSEVVSEDPRFLEREPPPLNVEFPDGSKVFFLGEHAYGVAAQVTGTTDTSLSVVIAVSFGLVRRCQECLAH
jgi:5'-3' exoribonuclease 1